MRPNLLPDLSSHELQAVCAIAEAGSFMAAAIDLGLSQPALTRIVQRVEKAVGLELFRRSTRRMAITPAGTEFIALANRILADLRISFDNLREISDEQRGRVIVSSVMSVAYSQLPLIVARYRGSRPRVELHIREGVHGTVLEDVRSGVADLGITYIDDVPPEFTATALAREALHVVMPKNHPLARRKGIALEELTPYPLVSLPREAHTRRLLDGLASVAGSTLQHAVTVTQFATVVQCVHAGVGLAIVPGGAVPTALAAGLASKPLTKPAITRTMGIVLLKDRGLPPTVQGFVADLKAAWPSARAATPINPPVFSKTGAGSASHPDKS